MGRKSPWEFCCGEGGGGGGVGLWLNVIVHGLLHTL